MKLHNINNTCDVIGEEVYVYKKNPGGVRRSIRKFWRESPHQQQNNLISAHYSQ